MILSRKSSHVGVSTRGDESILPKLHFEFHKFLTLTMKFHFPPSCRFPTSSPDSQMTTMLLLQSSSHKRAIITVGIIIKLSTMIWLFALLALVCLELLKRPTEFCMTIKIIFCILEIFPINSTKLNLKIFKWNSPRF